MAKPSEKPKPEKIETEPDAWERFERAVDTVTKKASNKGAAGRPARKRKQPDRLGDSDG